MSELFEARRKRKRATRLEMKERGDEQVLGVKRGTLTKIRKSAVKGDEGSAETYKGARSSAEMKRSPAAGLGQAYSGGKARASQDLEKARQKEEILARRKANPRKRLVSKRVRDKVAPGGTYTIKVFGRDVEVSPARYKEIMAKKNMTRRKKVRKAMVREAWELRLLEAGMGVERDEDSGMVRFTVPASWSEDKINEVMAQLEEEIEFDEDILLVTEGEERAAYMLLEEDDMTDGEDYDDGEWEDEEDVCPDCGHAECDGDCSQCPECLADEESDYVDDEESDYEED